MALFIPAWVTMRVRPSLRRMLSVSIFSGLTLFFLTVLPPTTAGPLPGEVATASSVESSNAHRDCSNPGRSPGCISSEDLFYPYQPSFGELPFNETHHRRRAMSPDEVRHVDSEATTCPEGKAVQADWANSRASTCPWIYENNYDPDRYPSAIPHAVCRCQGCLMNRGRRAHQSVEMECREVRYRIRVLRRRGCGDGLYKYDFEWYEVPVACACMRLPGSRDIRPPDM